MDFQDFRQVGVFGFEKEPNFECVASTDGKAPAAPWEGWGVWVRGGPRGATEEASLYICKINNTGSSPQLQTNKIIL